MVFRIILLGLLCSLNGARALVIDGFSAALNNRFANDPAFIADDYDLSGVGRSSDGRWGTLVSRNVFVSANHFRPGINSTLRFYQTNDSGGTFVERSVSSGQRLGVGDVWVGVLDNPVPNGYAVYDFATEDAADTAAFAATPYAAQLALMVGLSSTITDTFTDVAVGFNVMDGFVADITVSNISTTDDSVFLVDNQVADGNYVTYETIVQGGDSGSPLLFKSGSSVTIVGTGFYVSDSDFVDIDPTAGEALRAASGYTYLGNYDTNIQSIINANPIPEPRVIALILGLFALGWASRRRKSCA